MNVLKDTRTIRMIITRRGRDIFRTWAVGMRDIVAIKVEATPGQFAKVPWFAIYKDGHVVRRINGLDVAEVFYKL